MRRILLAGLVIGLVGAGYWRFANRGGPPAPEKATSSPQEGAKAATGDSPGQGNREAEGGAAKTPTPLRMRSSSPETESETVPPVAAKDSVADSFEAEERDEVLSARNSETVRNTVEHLAEMGTGTAHIAALDCRALHCKLQLSSDDQNGLVKLADALQDDRGFLGKAESIMLSRVEDDIVFYLRFSPPK